MQCPHCHNELPQGATIKLCPYCAKQLQINTPNRTPNDDLNRRSHPKWRENERICGSLSTFIAALYFLCFALPFVDLGLLGSLSGYELLAETVRPWFKPDNYLKAWGFLTLLVLLLLVFGIYLIGGVTHMASKGKYGPVRVYFFEQGVLEVILAAIVYIWVYKEVDGITSAIGFGPYGIILLALCELIVGVYSWSVYNRLPVTSVMNASSPQQAQQMPQAQQDGTQASTEEGTLLYDVILTQVSKKSSLAKIAEVPKMLGMDTSDFLSEYFEARNNPPVQIATAVGEPYAKLLSDKLREIGATAEIRPHTTM